MGCILGLYLFQLHASALLYFSGLYLLLKCDRLTALNLHGFVGAVTGLV